MQSFGQKRGFKRQSKIRNFWRWQRSATIGNGKSFQKRRFSFGLLQRPNFYDGNWIFNDSTVFCRIIWAHRYFARPNERWATNGRTFCHTFTRRIWKLEKFNGSEKFKCRYFAYCGANATTFGIGASFKNLQRSNWN